jgi:hypothetical protein
MQKQRKKNKHARSHAIKICLFFSASKHVEEKRHCLILTIVLSGETLTALQKSTLCTLLTLTLLSLSRSLMSLFSRPALTHGKPPVLLTAPEPVDTAAIVIRRNTKDKKGGDNILTGKTWCQNAVKKVCHCVLCELTEICACVHVYVCVCVCGCVLYFAVAM